MPKFIFTELVDIERVITARLGAGTGSANWLSDADVGKFVKLAGESRFNLNAVGDEIEGRIAGLNVATMDDYTIGSVQTARRFECTFDGLQATPGTGVIAIGAVVVTGTPVARGTALTGPARVCQATTPANVVTKWRVVSLGSAGTGAVGTTGLIERVA